VAAFRSTHGKPFEQADDREIEEFVTGTRRTLLLDIQKAVRAVQPDISIGWNGAGTNDIVRPQQAQQVDALVDWFSMEGHTWANIDLGSRLGHAMDRPFEVGILVNSSWYVPMVNQAPPPATYEAEAIVGAATAWIQGANVYASLTPGHSGRFDEKGDLRLLRAAGGWLKENRPWLTGVAPYADVGILMGNPSPEIQQIPRLADLWKASHLLERELWGRVNDHPGTWPDRGLRKARYFTELIGGSFAGRSFDLNSYRMLLIPETALLDDQTIERIREYVRTGGKVLAFGHASLFDQKGNQKPNFALSGVFGVDFVGALPGYKQMLILPGAGLTSTLPLNTAALAVQATSGKVLASWNSAGNTPAVVENSFGKGRSIYVSAEETAFGEESMLPQELTARLIGAPPITVQGTRDYALLMNHKGDDLLLYLLNRSTAPRAMEGPYKAANPARPAVETPEIVLLAIDTSALGEIKFVEMIPSRRQVAVSRRVGTLQFYVEASPAVTGLRLANKE
jgi:hypothetical protein